MSVKEGPVVSVTRQKIIIELDPESFGQYNFMLRFVRIFD